MACQSQLLLVVLLLIYLLLSLYLQGGIEFDVLAHEALGEKVQPGSEFTLYNNKAEILEQERLRLFRVCIIG